MSNEESKLVGGLYPKRKHANAPDFVIAKLNINVQQFREWMAAHLRENPDAEWINLDMKESRAGKGYAVVDEWKPDQSQAAPQKEAAPPDDFESEKIPF